MAVCETCWTEATWQAALGRGATADLYQKQLALFPNGHPEDTNEVEN